MTVKCQFWYFFSLIANSSKEAKLRSAPQSSTYGKLWSEKVLPHRDQSLVTDLGVAMERAWLDGRGAVYHDVNVIAANVPSYRRCEFVQVKKGPPFKRLR